ncbi:MAG: beta-galactosidase [Clostridiales bacterium]|nr:beta-galactosidase [Clostridiales bacterium]
MHAIPRSEYPRPQLVRSEWINLNGTWQFDIDHGVTGRDRKLMNAESLPMEIIVPFCPESDLSGIGNKDFMNCVWYKRKISLPEAWQTEGRRTILHIGACDYVTEVWVNGVSVGKHTGGYISFSFDITDYLSIGENDLTICANDTLRTGKQPSGKQSPLYHSHGCHYTRTTGIWQTVWLENVPSAYISHTKYTTDIEKGTLTIEATCENAHGMTLSAEALWEGTSVGSASATVSGRKANLVLSLSELHLWSTQTPALYDLKLTLGDDTAESYFGMRSIAYANGKLLLNGKPVFQRLILDQGFYPDGIYTAPTDEALKHDIEMSMAMGFNGARLHEKIFEERFLYHCDKLGYIVWGEHANWGLDISKLDAWPNFLPEWLEALQRDFNHPAIVGWCPLNETQGNQDPEFVRFLVNVTRAYDPTRPVLDASGWTHVKDLVELTDAHDYEQDPEKFAANLAKFEVPIFISEFGGIGWSMENSGWGYGVGPQSEEEFLSRYEGLVKAMLSNPNVYAFCYTQLTDVEQEQNGLYSYNRVPKFDPKIIASFNTVKAAIEE